MDMVLISLDMGEKNDSIIELLQYMRNEVASKNVPDGPVQLNYRELFKVFTKYRKIKLLRYLFNQKLEFEFNVSIFIMALEEDAYDIAALLHQEFVV